MHGHAASKHSLSYEEKVSLLEDRSPSDVESESGHIDLENRFGLPKWAAFMSVPVVRSAPWRVVNRLLVFMIPSFLQGRHAREQIRPAKLAPTAYLDGMRGLAALIVFFCHLFYQAFTIAESWGTGENNYHFLKLPFIRIFYQGPPAVCVFFVISGYALSYRPLKLIRSHSYSDLATTMSSLIFRRGIRLYLPTAISTFMIVCLVRSGAYELTRDFANDRTYMKNIVEPHPARMESAYDQWADWLWQMFEFIHVFSWNKFGGTTKYDVHLWTIPVEFRCSLYLFLAILGTARLRTRWRFLTIAGVMWITYRNCRWELVLFFCGMLIAELDHIRGAHIPPPALPIEEKLEPSSMVVTQSKVMPWVWTLTSLVGLYLMCQPDARGDVAPGWIYLTSLIPPWWNEEGYRYWQSIGAVIFVFAVGHCPGWQRFFNTAFVQYFGKISYAIYLMHGPAMHAVGYHWQKLAYSYTGVEGYWYNTGFVLGACLVIPTVVWWADVFWRAVDIPTVKFAKWVETKLIVSA
ncbi:acyltransferase family-domain-containing protein [Stachybotrys elegans]|uniref:Acyltransferase family-domain-containing protein n=1 Tax=Stachybotrys elegans TaxID=80388 RepID=A0A8K0WVC8_9HYPO|nr:acyltransferase family-domain-containing protein [Stachybotrys elegans]